MAGAIWLLLMTSLIAALLHQVQLCEDRSRWRRVFALDVAAHGHNHTFPDLAFPDCVHACMELAGCRMFGHSSVGATCWLYDHVVDANSSGDTVPDTRYWTSCPLDYIRTSGVCFKWVDIRKNWTEARDYCKKEGGDLFVADSAEKLGLLDYPIWGHVGGTLEEGVWRWLNGKLVLGGLSQIFPSLYYAYGTCLFADVRRLFDVNCATQYPFICEIEL